MKYQLPNIQKDFQIAVNPEEIATGVVVSRVENSDYCAANF